jgi:hypothetical protein
MTIGDARKRAWKELTETQQGFLFEKAKQEVKQLRSELKKRDVRSKTLERNLLESTLMAGGRQRVSDTLEFGPTSGGAAVAAGASLSYLTDTNHYGKKGRAPEEGFVPGSRKIANRQKRSEVAGSSRQELAKNLVKHAETGSGASRSELCAANRLLHSQAALTEPQEEDSGGESMSMDELEKEVRGDWCSVCARTAPKVTVPLPCSMDRVCVLRPLSLRLWVVEQPSPHIYQLLVMIPQHS